MLKSGRRRVPKKFKQTIVIAAPAAELFAYTQDYGRRLEWDPFLRSARLLGGAIAAGLGVRSYCVAHNGMAMETEYVSFNPPRVCAVKMIRGPRMIGGFAASWAFEEIQPAQTRVVYRWWLSPRPGWLSRLLLPIIAWAFARDTRKRLAALKSAFEKRAVSPPCLSLAHSSNSQQRS
jgi:hypothetical protein